MYAAGGWPDYLVGVRRGVGKLGVCAVSGDSLMFDPVIQAEERRLGLPEASLRGLGCFPALRAVIDEEGLWTHIDVVRTPVFDYKGLPQGYVDRCSQEDADRFWDGSAVRNSKGCGALVGLSWFWGSRLPYSLVCEGVSDWQTAATVLWPSPVVGVLSASRYWSEVLPRCLYHRWFLGADRGLESYVVICADGDETGLAAAERLVETMLVPEEFVVVVRFGDGEDLSDAYRRLGWRAFCEAWDRALNEAYQTGWGLCV